MKRLFRNRRKRRIVNPRFQFRFSMILFAQVAIAVLGMSVSTWLFLRPVGKIVSEVSLADEAVGAELRPRYDRVGWQVVAGGLLGALVTVGTTLFIGLRASHRLVGPVGRLREHVGEHLFAPEAVPIQFRKSDHLEQTVAQLAATGSALRLRRAELDLAVRELAGRVKDLPESGGEGYVARLDEIERLLGRLRAS